MDSKELIEVVERAGGWHEVEMSTGRAFQLRSGPVDRMIVIYHDGGAIRCADRGAVDDVVYTTPDAAAEWVRAASAR